MTITGTPPTRSVLWLPTAAGVLGLVLTVVAFSVPGGRFVTGLAAAAVFGVAVLLWVGTAVAVVLRRRRGAHAPVRSLVWLPVLGMVAAGLVVTGLPLKAAFMVSRPALDAAAERVGPEPGRTGVFDISAVRQQPNGCVALTVNDAGFLDPEGFARCPQPREGRADGDTYTPFDGPWHLWREDF